MRLDPKTIESLRALGGDGSPDFLFDLIDTYFADSPVMLTAIEQAAVAGDFDTLYRQAHGLKGCCGNLGAMMLAKTCESMQVAADKRDARAITTVLAALQAEFAATERELRVLRSR